MPGYEIPKTSWTLVLRAKQDTPGGREALQALCKAYWFPVFAFIRHRVGSADKAADRTQGFFARTIVEKNAIASFDEERGTKFRSWLLGCVRNYLAYAYHAEP